MKLFRQGDVLLVAITTMPEEQLVEVPAEGDGSVVLAYGEVTTHRHRIVTGHSHAIADRDCALYEADGLGDRFLQVLADGGVDLVHEEHASIHIPQGAWIVRRQREYEPGALPRRVVD